MYVTTLKYPGCTATHVGFCAKMGGEQLFFSNGEPHDSLLEFRVIPQASIEQLPNPGAFPSKMVAGHLLG